VLQLRDSRRNLLSGRDVTWRSLAPGVAQVSTTGLVTAVGVGIAQILAASEGLADTSTVIVGSPPVVAVRVQPDSASVLVGGSVRLSATAVSTRRSRRWTARDSSAVSRRAEPASWPRAMAWRTPRRSRCRSRRSRR
jgi:uncharacterized protein YjdB